MSLTNFLGAMLITTSSLFCAPQELYIVIHGTWAQHEAWAQPGGDFFEALHRTIGPTATIEPFFWSGKNNHAERLNAAQSLARLIDTIPLSTTITLIAHSHGANVAFIASQKLTRRAINQIFALGAPIDCARCKPNMNTIGRLYNLFSFGDPVQTVSGYFERALPTHTRSTNMRLMLNGTNPNHAQLHDKIVGHWLENIPQMIAKANKKGDTEMPPFVTLELSDYAAPCCRIDQLIPRLLEDEKRVYAVLVAQMLPRSKTQKLTQQPL